MKETPSPAGKSESGGKQMDLRRLTIGEMAALNHISEQTLRLYDREELLVPLHRDEKNGYRYYDIRQSARLDMIQYMKALGMSLKEIRLYLHNWNAGRLRRLLQRNRDLVEQRMRDLQLQKQAIDRALENYARFEQLPPDGTLVVEYIPRRRIFVTDTGINFYDFAIEEYERLLRMLKEELRESGAAPFYFSHAGSLLRKERFERNELVATEVFVFVDEETMPLDHTQMIPEGLYLCRYCDCFEKEKEGIAHLQSEIARCRYQVRGDYICEVMAEMPREDEDRGMFLRLQVPISWPEN